METIKNLLSSIEKDSGRREILTYVKYLELVRKQPTHFLRDVFQLFCDMIDNSITRSEDEYPDDPESISYVNIDTTNLFVEGFDQPFFADRLFANRFVNAFDAMKNSNQQNKIFLFPGPHGCGKSTFLNNLLYKFQEYVNSDKGKSFEIVWKLDTKLFNVLSEEEINPTIQVLIEVLMSKKEFKGRDSSFLSGVFRKESFEIQCPSHDHPIFLIPKKKRREFLARLLKDSELSEKLFSEKQFEWIFEGELCAICRALYQAVIDRVGSFEKVFPMVFARRYIYDRLLGEGISVLNPGDRVIKDEPQKDTLLQKEINELLGQSSHVKYLYSPYARTNNGLYALMDLKGNNRVRYDGLHGILSESVHKVAGLVEESVTSLFLAVANNEDIGASDDQDSQEIIFLEKEKEISKHLSFRDRVVKIKMAYTLEFKTEVLIYEDLFGSSIGKQFLPRVLENFAKVIISSRLKDESEAIIDWIDDPDCYEKNCDASFHLLKMDIVSGVIPEWLTEKDRKSFTKQVRKNIIEESEEDGLHGFSGRESLRLFSDFMSRYGSSGRLITMKDLFKFFTRKNGDVADMLPSCFLISLVGFYNFSVLEEVKEALYYYNEEEIKKIIANYLFAISFEDGYKVRCPYTKDILELSSEFFADIERKIFTGIKKNKKLELRGNEQRRYISETIQEIKDSNSMVEISRSRQFIELKKSFERNLKSHVLDPFMHNENFRNAIKDFDTDKYGKYDKKIALAINRMINNLSKRGYKKQEAKEICVYLIDNKLVEHFQKINK